LTTPAGSSDPIADPSIFIPVWVRALDWIAIVAAVLGVFVVLFGGFSTQVGPLRLSIRSPLRLFFIAIAAAAVRHAASPAEPLHRRILRGLRSARSDSPASIALGALSTRIAVLLIGYFAVLTVGMSKPQVGFELSSDPVLNLPARFDAGWYGGIAIDGYFFEGRFDKQQNVAFFPVAPFLMRGAGHFVGAFEPGIPKGVRMARALWAGVVISIVAFAWAARYLVRLARDTIGEAHSADAVWLLAAYPFSVFYSAPYTEALFFLGAVGAFYHFRRREWVPAIAWGLLVGLTRPNGFLLSVALGCFAIEDVWRERRKTPVTIALDLKALLAVAAPVVGMLAYSTYVHSLTGSWFGWARLHEAWGRSFEGVAPIARGFGWIENEGLLRVVAGLPYDTLNTLALLFALALVWPVFRRLGLAWAVFVLVNVVPPMLAGGVLSMGRLTSTLFPLFLALALVLPRRAVAPLIIAFAIAQGLAATLFFTWRPLF
jgi:hypothetical protein